MLRRLALAFIPLALSIALIGSLLLDIVGSENAAIIRACLTVLGIAVVLALFVITARQLNRAHASLEQSRLAARDLIELASDGIFIADLNGRFSYVNGAGCRMLGYSRDELLGKTIVDLIPPEDEARLLSHRERFLQGGADVSEWRLLTKSGTYLPVEVSAKILPDGRWVAFDRDISERKRAEKLLRQAQERFELALEGADLASWDWNIVTGEVISNPRCAEMRGYRPDEIRPYVDAYIAGIHPDDRPAFQKALNDCLEGIRPEFECEYRASTKSGGWVWLLSKGKIFGRDDAGRPTRMVGTALDITEQKQAEAEDRLLAELGVAFAGTLEFEDVLTKIARLLVRDFADLCIIDIIEDDGSIERARVVGREPANAWLCDALLEMPRDRERAPVWGAVLETGQAALFEGITPNLIGWAATEEHLSALQRAGLRSAIVAPLTAQHGKLLGMVSLLSLSRAFGPADLRMAELVAQRAALLLDNSRLFAKTRRAIQARDDMLGVVAHDLRNPLAAITMLAAVVRRDESVRDVGEEIDEAVNRMDSLIQDLIDVTRMEAGHSLSLGLERTKGAALISDTVKGQTPHTSAAALELRLDAAPNLPDIWADRERLLRVFENLIGNAIKFTKPGGKITLAAAPREDAVLFTVADTGSGISSDHLPHLFDRFWRAPQNKRPGAGLGLAIVKGIVEAHGGRIWVQSTPGQGSTFFFTIPTAASKATPIRAPIEAGLGDASALEHREHTR